VIVDAGETGGYESVQAPGGVISEVPGEERVNAGPGEEGFDEEFHDRDTGMHLSCCGVFTNGRVRYPM
jgi:hypothetical protein